MPALYGIIDQRDLNRPVETITEVNLAAAMRVFLDQYNAAMNQMLGDFAVRTTLYQERFRLPVAAGELQPSDEYSRSIMTRRPDMPYYDVAYPLKQWDDRIGWTQLFLAKATGARIQEDIDASQQRDRLTMIKDLLRSLMYKTNYTWNDEERGVLNIKRLLNGDGVIPPAYAGKTFDGTHTHYFGANTATITAAVYTTVYEHLREHGLGSNVIVEIARNLETTTKGLTAGGFVASPEFTDSRVVLPAGQVTAYARLQDPRAIGRIANMEVRVNDNLPDNYLFAYDAASDPPLAFREDEQPALNGFRNIQDNPSDNYPLRNSFFVRRAGFGVRNRANGVAVQIVASTTYTDPTI